VKIQLLPVDARPRKRAIIHDTASAAGCEAHLRRILKSYADHCNGIRTHRSLNKDAPVTRLEQRAGVIRSRAILDGLHHHYGRF
jgi:hypothetical protein